MPTLYAKTKNQGIFLTKLPYIFPPPTLSKDAKNEESIKGDFQQNCHTSLSQQIGQAVEWKNQGSVWGQKSQIRV